MLIGSGLLAKAFFPSCSQREDICVYAAGVSNSVCSDAREFMRERQRLTETLAQTQDLDAFVYFGTCSVMDPEATNTPYVQHKVAMERLVSTHPRHLILRLPQVAGKTPNPHTLLNFLYSRISRSEAFPLWRKARRNIIDVTDVVSIADCLITAKSARNVILNVANPLSYPMPDIVTAMERAAGKRAIYHVVERGSDYPIDVKAVLPLLHKVAVQFGDAYLEHVINKYHGDTH